MKLHLTKNKGITLIALIITIIVLLILAGITIGALTTNNSILKQSGNAKNESEIGKEKELLQVGIYGAMTTDKENRVTEENLRNEMKAYATVETKRKKLIVTFNDSQRQYEVDTVGEIKEYKTVDVSKLPFMNNNKFIDYMSDDKESVLSVTVLDNLNPPAETYKIFDVSTKQDESIKAWLIENSEIAGKYDLYIGCNGGVRLDNGWNTFMGYSNCTNMDLDNLYTDDVKSLRGMFTGCSSLTSLDLNSWNTENVESLFSTFENCNRLENLNVSNWNTENVKEMGSPVGYSYGGAFRFCSRLKQLDLSGWNTENVTIMHRMFEGCSSLTSLDLSNFDTRNVEYMTCMFRVCGKLTSLDLSNFNTEKVKNMEQMFYDCKELQSINMTGWDTSKVTNMAHMFRGCEKMVTINVSHFNTESVSNMFYMFGYCKELVNLDLNNFDTKNVTNVQYMFSNSKKLSNDSLNSILLICSKATKVETKTLSSMILTSAQASICTGLSNYPAFTAAGWTTGY